MEKSRRTITRRTVLLTVLTIILLTAVVGVVYARRILQDPRSLFTAATVTENDELSTGINAEDEEDGDVPQTPSSPDIINIMLMGIDAYEDGTTTSGTEAHADVCMVIAVNFATDTIDLISLPRDTFTTTPGYYGYYKLNCVFNVGGGLDDPDGGFAQICRTAERWLGGVSVPYYYGVDFQAVVDIVDAIGGIDFEVDTPYHTLTGKYYSKGMQHLDGDGVMGYLRIRTEADGLDSSRTARQRKMMVAIFNKLKTEGSLTKIPALISAASSGIYTNTNLAQTTALVNYAANIDPDSIRTRSMPMELSSNYTWMFAFPDQQGRIDLLKEVYGIDAQPLGVSTPAFERWLHETGFNAAKCIRQTEKVLAFYQTRQASGVVFDGDAAAAYTACQEAYTALHDAYLAATQALVKAFADPDVTDQEIYSLRGSYASELAPLRTELENAAAALASRCGYTDRLTWWVDPVKWGWDTDINQVAVDFN